MATEAMLAPLNAPNSVPPPTADTARRPGRRPIQWSAASTVMLASPVRINNSPIRMKSGIGMSANWPTEENALVANRDSATSPPMKK